MIMTSIFEDTNPRPLKELLSQIHSREAALPDFQRDFVWDPYATRELILSIAQNYPAGSLLRIRNTHALFAFREFQGAPQLNGHRPTYLVLDGQQRLTSLYQAFYGVGDHRYFLHVGKLLDNEDIEDCVFYARANTSIARAYEDMDLQSKNRVVPLGVLRNGIGGFTKWTRDVARRLSGDERNALEDALSDVEHRWIQGIDDYAFPVVTLSDATNADAVCTIFETLNRTGVKLSPFELLTARFWPQNIKLRELWDRAKTQNPIIEDFEVDPYYMLQIIALAGRDTPSCKRSDVLDLTPQMIVDWWDKCADGLADGLRMLADDCGVIVPKWLPYNTIVIPLAAVIASIGSVAGPRSGENRQKLVRWFWCSVFGQTYESSPNSQAATDVAELRIWLAGGSEPQSVSTFRFDPITLRDITARQRALYRGVITLILSLGPRDFHNDARLTGELIIEHNVDDHHLFPAAYLDRHNVPTRLRDCVLNRTLIDRKTNIRIRDRAPSIYWQEISVARTPERFDQLLNSHLLPSAHASPLMADDFEAFLTWRQERIWREIQRATK